MCTKDNTDNSRIDQLQPPQSIEAERAVLGALLKDPVAYDRVVEVGLGSADFHEIKHQRIFRAMVRLNAKSEPVDIKTTWYDLTEEDRKKVGSQVYLIELVEDVASTVNVAAHARIVKEQATRRSLISICGETMRSCYAREVPTERLLDGLDGAITSIADVRSEGLVTAEDLASGDIEKLLKGEPLVNPEDVIETRIADLNRKLGCGLFRGDTVVVAGPPSMGKSAFALDTCHWNATLGRNSLYVSLDESKRAMAGRLISAETELSMGDYVTSAVSEEDRGLLRRVSRSLTDRQGRIFLETSLFMVSQIKARARQIKRKHGLDIVVVDYIGRVEAPEGMRNAGRTEVVSQNSRMLDALAQELNVLMVVVSQLNREYANLPLNPERGEYGIPAQSMLRDSGQLEADANVILFPWRLEEARRKRGRVREEDYATDGKSTVEDAIIKVAKNKVGPTGLVKCKFNGPQMRFYSEANRPDGGES